MLVRDSTSLANDTFGRHERQDSDVTDRKHETRPVRLSCLDRHYPIQSAEGAAAHV